MDMSLLFAEIAAGSTLAQAVIQAIPLCSKFLKKQPEEH
jgi:hypothetical protein